MKGIDISSWQKGLDLSAAGVDFAICKISEGTTWVDPCFEDFYEAAKCPLGAYVFSYATTEEKARREARKALTLINGRPLPLGIYIDVESPTQLQLRDSELTAVVKAFCDEIKAGGYIAGAYGSAGQLWAKVGPSYLGDDVIVWAASWGGKPRFSCDVWQYTDHEAIVGYNGPVDGDEAMSERFIALVNGTTPETPVEPPDEPPVEVDGIIMPNLAYGDGKGNGKKLAVKLMQTALIYHDCKCGWMGADGEFGNETKKALLKFQSEQSLPQTAVCQSADWKKLFSEG